jgi:WD40 repeat protein
MPQLQATLTGHTGAVTAIAIAPDSSWLASGSQDKTLRIWNAASCVISAVMRADRPFESCAWSPSGQALVTGGDAGLYVFASHAMTAPT